MVKGFFYVLRKKITHHSDEAFIFAVIIEIANGASLTYTKFTK